MEEDSDECDCAEDSGGEGGKGCSHYSKGRKTEVTEDEYPVQENVQDIGCDSNPHCVSGISYTFGEESGCEEQ